MSIKRRAAAALAVCLSALAFAPTAGAQSGDAYDGCGPWISTSYNVVNDPGGAHAQGNADHLLTVGMTWSCYYAFSIGHARLGTYRLHAHEIAVGEIPNQIEWGLEAQLNEAWALPWPAYYDRAFALFQAYCGVYGSLGCDQVIFQPVGGQQVVS